MNNEELEEIRKRAEEACTHKTLDADKTFDFFYYDVPKLLAEVERFRHALQTYREYGSLFIADMHNGFSLTDLVETRLSEEACGNDEE